MDNYNEEKFNMAKKIIIYKITKDIIDKQDSATGFAMEKYYMKIIGTIAKLNLEDC